MHSIALFGGTFDPIHQGHLKLSLNIQSVFHFNNYYFIPCKIPTLKAQPSSSTEHRLEMLRLALEPYPQFQIDLREIKRDTPSYMVETLTSLREEYPNESLTLVLGYDAFFSLNLWYEWEKIMDLANLLVMDRNHSNGASTFLPEDLKQLLIKHQTKNQTKILHQKAGIIYLFDAGDYDISSTQIRTLIKNNSLKKDLIPEPVLNYINLWGLYQ